MKISNIKVDREILKDLGKFDDKVKGLEIFDDFDRKLDKVKDLIEKVPDNSIVRPNPEWLKIFNL